MCAPIEAETEAHCRVYRSVLSKPVSANRLPRKREFLRFGLETFG